MSLHYVASGTKFSNKLWVSGGQRLFHIHHCISSSGTLGLKPRLIECLNVWAHSAGWNVPETALLAQSEGQIPSRVQKSQHRLAHTSFLTITTLLFLLLTLVWVYWPHHCNPCGHLRAFVLPAPSVSHIHGSLPFFISSICLSVIPSRSRPHPLTCFIFFPWCLPPFRIIYNMLFISLH